MFEEQIKRSQLKILKNKLNKGITDDTLFNKMLNKKFSREDLQCLREHFGKSDYIDQFLLKFLCKNGFQLKEFVQLKNRENFHTMIQIAKNKKDEEFLLQMLDEKNDFLVDVVQALIIIDKKQLLMSLLFSDDEQIVETIRKVMKNGQSDFFE